MKEPLSLPRGSVRAILTIMVVAAAIALAFVPLHGDAGAKQMIVLISGICLRDYFAHRSAQNAIDGPVLPEPSTNDEAP